MDFCMKDIEIARNAKLKRITEITDKLNTVFFFFICNSFLIISIYVNPTIIPNKLLNSELGYIPQAYQKIHAYPFEMS